MFPLCSKSESHMAEQFGAWLVGQAKRTDWVGQLADQASRDPRFPRAADPDTARNYLGLRGADPDRFEMLEDAEAEWRRGTC